MKDVTTKYILKFLAVFIAVSCFSIISLADSYDPLKRIPHSKLLVQPVDNRMHTGKEFQNLNGLGWYDNSARQMDAILGRFTTPDPLAEKYYNISPYAHCANNALKYIDPDGKQFIFVGSMNPILMGNSTPLLGVAEAIKVGAKNGSAEGHHIVPRLLKGNDVVKAAREGGFKFEGKGNRIQVEKFSKSTGKGQHGNHPKYSRQIENKLEGFKKENPNFTPEQAAKAVEQISNDAVNTIKNNPGMKINDLKLDVVLPTDNVKVINPPILEIEK